MNRCGIHPGQCRGCPAAGGLYLGTEDAARLDEVETKAKTVGYMRLLRRTIRRSEPNREELIAYYKERLTSLIPAVKELTF